MSGDSFLARQPSAVDSAFAVLEKVGELGPGVSARVLVEELPMSKATVYRIIKHLVEQEYLVRTPDLTGFMLGRRVLALAGAQQPLPGGDHAGTDEADRYGAVPSQ